MGFLFPICEGLNLHILASFLTMDLAFGDGGKVALPVLPAVDDGDDVD